MGQIVGWVERSDTQRASDGYCIAQPILRSEARIKACGAFFLSALRDFEPKLKEA